MLRSLYIKYDSIVAAGNDVVADLSKEINNLEISYLRESVIPRVAKILHKEISGLRCSVGCSLQSSDGKIEYSFCTDNSPLVRGTLSTADCMDSGTPDLDMVMAPEIIGKLSSSLNRLSELSAEIENCKSEALGYISQLKESNCKKVGNLSSRPAEDVEPTEVLSGTILYCRSNDCNAKGKLLPDRKISILKGSLLRKDTTPTYGCVEFRLDILARYCAQTDKGYIVLSDLPPFSVSRASGLCLGRSSNGNTDWKDEYGNRLCDLE